MKPIIRIYLFIFFAIVPFYVVMEFMKMANQHPPMKKISKSQVLQLVVEETYFQPAAKLDDDENKNIQMKMSVQEDDVKYLLDKLKYPKGQQMSLLEVEPVLHNPHFCFSSAYHSPHDQDSQADLNTSIPKQGPFVPKSGWTPLEEGLNVTEKIDWIIYVHTSVKNIQKRQVIRKTWGFPRLFKNYNTRLIFVVGRPDVPALQNNLEMEFAIYGDILQGDFLDAYKNITYKAVFTLRWLTTYCSHVPIVMKSDDDTFINIFHIKDYLIRYSNFQPITDGASNSKAKILNTTPKPGLPITMPPKTLICKLHPKESMPILRDKSTCLKWCLNKMDLPGLKFYPSYCSGLVYFFTMPLIMELYEQVKTTPFLWIDDVYVTGLLPAKVANINYVNIQADVTLHSEHAINSYKNQSESITEHVVHAVHAVRIATLWNLLLSRLSEEQAKELTLPVNKLKLKTTTL